MQVSRLAIAALSLAAFAADNGSLTGKWQLHTVAQGNERSYVCTFNQSEQSLSGTCDTQERTVQISGKIAGKKVTWTYKSEYNGSPLTVIFKGTIDSAAKITGTVLAEEYNVEGEFVATAAR